MSSSESEYSDDNGGVQPLRHDDIDVDYCPEAYESQSLPDTDELHIRVTFDARGGARWRSKHRFRPGGAVEGRIRAPEGNTSGLNYNLYLSSQEGAADQDEIDFEFLGHHKGAIQTNYHVNGEGGREQMHELPFDSSEDFHHYAIAWDAEFIEWRVDGEVIRREVRQDEGEPWPTKPMYLYASVWDASHVDEGRWTGTYKGTDEPYFCHYRAIKVPMALKVREDGDEEREREEEEEEATRRDADVIVDAPPGEEEETQDDAGDVLVEGEEIQDADAGDDALVEEEEGPQDADAGDAPGDEGESRDADAGDAPGDDEKESQDEDAGDAPDDGDESQDADAGDAPADNADADTAAAAAVED